MNSHIADDDVKNPARGHKVEGMAINVSVQYNGGSLPDIIMLTQGYYHWGTHLNAMKRLYF